MVWAVDAAFVSRVDPYFVGAIGLMGTMMWLINTIAEGFSVGLIACLARMIGAGDTKQARQFTKSGIIFISLLGLVILPLVYFSRWSLYSLLQTPSEIVIACDDYFSIMAFAFPGSDCGRFLQNCEG